MSKMMTPAQYANACARLEKKFREVKRKNLYPGKNVEVIWWTLFDSVICKQTDPTGDTRRIKIRYPAPPNSSPYEDDYPYTEEDEECEYD